MKDKETKETVKNGNKYKKCENCIYGLKLEVEVCKQITDLQEKIRKLIFENQKLQIDYNNLLLKHFNNLPIKETTCP
jgi:regulator of replication initiation timing